MTTRKTPRKRATPAKPPRSSSLATLTARLADAEALIDGQRRDFDQLATVLQVRDVKIASLERHAQTVAQSVALSAEIGQRLTWYEQHVQVLVAAKIKFGKAVRKEAKRREKLIAAHPELTEDQKARIREMGGSVDALTASPNGTGPHLVP